MASCSSQLIKLLSNEKQNFKGVENVISKLI